MDTAQALHPVPTDGDLTIAYETPEHEVIELDGCSKAELDAKRHDFLAWAS